MHMIIYRLVSALISETNFFVSGWWTSVIFWWQSSCVLCKVKMWTASSWWTSSHRFVNSFSNSDIFRLINLVQLLLAISWQELFNKHEATSHSDHKLFIHDLCKDLSWAKEIVSFTLSNHWNIKLKVVDILSHDFISFITLNWDILHFKLWSVSHLFFKSESFSFCFCSKSFLFFNQMLNLGFKLFNSCVFLFIIFSEVIHVSVAFF